MVCLFQPLIKSPSVHWGGVSDPVPCIVGSCVRRSLLLLLLLLPPPPPPHPDRPHPSSPSASAGQPQKRWPDSREAPILQPRQSRLHRWVTIKHARRLHLPLNFFFFQGWEAQTFEITRSCFRDCFFVLVCYFWRRSCVHFSCKRGIFSSQACDTLQHTRTKQICQRAEEESQRVWSELLCLCFCCLSPLTSLILAPGVTYWTVSNPAKYGLSEAEGSGG